jgi:hypothetical protein
MMDILQESSEKYKNIRKNSAYWSKAKNKDWQQKASKAVSKKKKYQVQSTRTLPNQL